MTELQPALTASFNVADELIVPRVSAPGLTAWRWHLRRMLFQPFAHFSICIDKRVQNEGGRATDTRLLSENV